MAGIRTIRLRVAASAGERLDVLLGARLPEALGVTLSKSAVRRLIMAGAVSIGGRPLLAPGRVVRPGQEVVVRVDPARLEVRAGGDAAFVLTPAAILYEDDVLIAVSKPSGLPTVPTADPTRPSLVRAVEAYLGRNADFEVALGVHQRLDAETSGIVLFAKDPAANPGLARAFAGRAVEKVYHALTIRPKHPPPAPWRAVSRLGPVGRGRMGRVGPGGQDAVTDLRVFEVLPRALLVEARPRTGRKHQIRAHLAEHGLPILGDRLYGNAASASAPRTMLHASSLRLAHPLSQAALVIECAWPADFERLLAMLRGQATEERRAASRRRPRGKRAG